MQLQVQAGDNRTGIPPLLEATASIPKSGQATAPGSPKATATPPQGGLLENFSGSMTAADASVSGGGRVNSPRAQQAAPSGSTAAAEPSLPATPSGSADNRTPAAGQVSSDSPASQQGSRSGEQPETAASHSKMSVRFDSRAAPGLPQSSAASSHQRHAPRRSVHAADEQVQAGRAVAVDQQRWRAELEVRLFWNPCS